MRPETPRLLTCLLLAFASVVSAADAGDVVHDLQQRAIEEGRSDAAHWGNAPDRYTAWGTHTNRLIPIYTFGTKDAGDGVDLRHWTGENSPYRSEQALRRLYGKVPADTLNPEAVYCDQANLADIQRAAIEAGKKHIFVVVFDGMDWQTTQAAAIASTGRVPYTSGRGTGLHFLDYMADGSSQYGFMVAAPHNQGTSVDVDTQTVRNPGGVQPGGYDVAKAGPNPWTAGNDSWYPMGLVGEKEAGPHPYPDSAATATAICAGVKTYNGSINVGPTGERVSTIAHEVQQDGWLVGAISSVPISHATPASAYGHNVTRNDYQDITRDLLGLPSISHPDHPLPGLDVLIGAGFGATRDNDRNQGENYVPGNRYLAGEDLEAIDIANGGKYRTVLPTPGVDGGTALREAAGQAAANGERLFGFFGIGRYGHLPFQTADGDYQPAPGRSGKAESYSAEELLQNPTLAEMTTAALEYLGAHDKPFWLLVESGDVDWANHDNNLDNSIGAVRSGDDAVKVITDWVEENSDWSESLMIVTADHGHYLNLVQPEALAGGE
ncbi:Alkaline phosphatase 4 precursor [Maioricimonas rarisocia]|uniref:Alkaline phosphatase 4 n=1 Tax=Maioricimonas rarisocia TaxID=2528026 RepID=A0A517Z2B5_9PLAN|nr:alkaline phosphatase [Maioricimonas rarisocia]QDU36613.1 Alkaline phosphatase 4 precursor [Maioricimonas rarisocia]